MQTKKPVLMEPGHTDEIYTPDYALNPLMPFVKSSVTGKEYKRVLESFPGEGHLVRSLEKRGFEVVTDVDDEWDIMITNPPYKEKDHWINWAFYHHKPFAYLLPTTCLGGIRRGRAFRRGGIQLIIPDRRINFVTPNGGKSSWFHTSWFTHGFNLGHDLNFVEMVRE